MTSADSCWNRLDSYRFVLTCVGLVSALVDSCRTRVNSCWTRVDSCWTRVLIRVGHVMIRVDLC